MHKTKETLLIIMNYKKNLMFKIELMKKLKNLTTFEFWTKNNYFKKVNKNIQPKHITLKNKKEINSSLKIKMKK